MGYLKKKLFLILNLLQGNQSTILVFLRGMVIYLNSQLVSTKNTPSIGLEGS